MSTLIRRVLVANRGEIAIRIFRAATELNIHTIGIFSYEDRFSLHRFKADEAYFVGKKGDPIGSYLNIDNIIQIAKKYKIEAIHPGYGFLSESAEFAQACKDQGIIFIGPSIEVLRTFGDKLASKKAALDADLSIIPGTDNPLANLDEAKTEAKKMGYPVTLKALFGGGGKGIRFVENEKALEREFERARSESLKSFGRDAIYMEKTIQNPKHIEIQIMGDQMGNIIHLFERDCSIQRRHQKILEMAPSLGLSEDTRQDLYDQAKRLAKSVGFSGVGTVEFLVDKKGRAYFLEVNPRVQVEHTVTEEITGIDIVQSSILIASGKPLSHPAIGIQDQESVKMRGVAIQARITTEDPLNNFAPNTGVILAYRSAAGFGIRLDSGIGTSGGEVTPHYDSLLVKITARSLDLYGASKKLQRSLREFRIRGVKTNIPLMINIVSHPSFLDSTFTTNFLDETPELYIFRLPRDRATKLLKYISNVLVNNPHELPRRPNQLVFQSQTPIAKKPPEKKGPTAKEVFNQKGADGLVAWIKNQKPILLTDTTMRDAHQSLFATRLRTYDIRKITPYYNENATGLFSLEMWGGATFDTCLRFLKEDPWRRLEKVRKAVPNTLLQMLLRGSNAVGYANYPNWVVKEFIRQSVASGIDLFRIFDCLNNPSQMKVSIEEVKKQGAIVEACLCYTGNFIDPRETKYTLNYYLNIARELKEMGTDILCIKDMAGLLRPDAAKELVSALKNETDLPIHLHTHDTSGNGGSTLLAACHAGCDIVDGAVSSMSGLTSQPSLNSLVAALENSKLCPDVPLDILDDLSLYWKNVRDMYKVFDPGITSTTTRVYSHEIPGGQYSNLYDQAQKVGLSINDFRELTNRYQEVNELLGDIVKVTPSSKVVGDFALLLQKNNLTGPEFMEKKPSLDFPDSVMSFFKGHMGQPYGGFPEEIRKLILGESAPPPQAAPIDKEDDLNGVRHELSEKLNRNVTDKEVLSYRIFPKVFLDYFKHQNDYGNVDQLPTAIYFYGPEVNKEFYVDIEVGKTLYIELKGISEIDENGDRSIFFKLNGFPREIRIRDFKSLQATSSRPKADLTNTLHISAPMPGKVVDLKVKVGDSVEKGQTLFITDSMKMEYIVTAKTSGVVKAIHVKPADTIESEDLLVELKS